jgi:hypothetical protein
MAADRVELSSDTLDALASQHAEPFGTIASGEIAGSVTAAALPNIPCSFARLKARSTNAGSVFIGGSSVTKPNGVTDATSGFELAANHDTGWMPISNLNLLSRICDNAGDALTYLVVV